LQQNCYLIDVQKGVGPEPQTIELDVVYSEALYFTDEDSGVRGLQFNLYKDYDSSTETVTYPDFYIGVAPKSETALAGTYSANDIYFVEMDIAANTTVEAEEILSDFVVTWLGKDEEGNNLYQYTFKFLGDDGNTYIINLEETDTRAYDNDTGAEVEIDEEGGSSVEPGYYLVGSFTEWQPLSSYMLSLNQAAEAEEYMIEVRLFAGNEFKVVQVDEAGAWTWFPDGENNNYVVSEDLGIATVYFRPDGQGGEGWHYGYIYVEPYQEPQVPLYDVAEAIAAELAKDDVIQVRGIITKIEFKGKNFAKYGSVCFYVKDASGAEGEFEFFNCYSLDEKKFTVSDPEFDETSTQWAQFDAVTDEDGNVIEVGDLIIAQGKYEFYNNQKHELQQNCYLIDVQKGVGPEPQGIEEITADGQTIKVLRNGHVFILRGDKIFNLQGILVK
jgi:hypothetical protein